MFVWCEQALDSVNLFEVEVVCLLDVRFLLFDHGILKIHNSIVCSVDNNRYSLYYTIINYPIAIALD